MLNDQTIKDLLDIYDNTTIGPEYSNTRKPFFDGSFEKYAMSIKLDYEKRQLINFSFISLIKSIDEIKQSFISPAWTIGLNTFVKSSDHNKKLKDTIVPLTSQELSKNSIKYFNQWMEFANQHQVKIDSEITKFNLHIEKLKNFQIFDNIFNELKKINMVCENIHKIEKEYKKKVEASYMPETTVLEYNKKIAIGFISPDTPIHDFDSNYQKYSDELKLLFNSSSFNHLTLIVKNNDFNIIEYIKDNDIFSIFDEIKETIKNIEYRIKEENPNLYFSIAEKVADNNISSNLNTFLEKKADLLKANKEIDIDIPNISISKIKEFETDFSLLAEQKDGSFINIDSIEKKNNIIQNLFKAEINHVLRKSPMIAKLFIDKLAEDYTAVSCGIIAANTYIQYQDILKSKEYNIIDEIKELYFEDLDDSMHNFIKKHQVKQYAHSIASNKYNHLYNQDTYKACALLFEIDIKTSELQATIGKKMASFNSPDEFNQALNKLYRIHSLFDIETTRERSLKSDIDIVIDKDNILVMQIDSYKKSQILGSASWCIVRQESYFKSYTENDARQYFIYDFNKLPSDNDSIIGLTLYPDGLRSASHLKNDDNVMMNDFLSKIQLDILIKQKDKYPDMNEDLKISITKIIEKNNVQKNKLKMD